MKPELELLQRANSEIRILRNKNQLMAARLDMFDKCVLLLTANLSNTSQGRSPDITWEIDKFIHQNDIQNKKDETD